MVLKRHEDKPWEWVDNKCAPQMGGMPECNGVMELKNVNLKGGSMFSEDPHPVKYNPPYLEKIWVCTECGFVFLE